MSWHNRKQQDDKMDNTWEFLRSNSTWPLIHVILAYHAYMYGRSWKAVLLSYYLFKTFQIFFFAVLGLDYKWLFLDILVDDDYRTNPTGLENQTDDDSWEDPFDHKDNFRCVFNVNEFLLGGTLLTILGIFLAWCHVYVLLGRFSRVSSFHPVTFWKSKDVSSAPCEIARSAMQRNKDLFPFGSRYGFWPLGLIFGLEVKHYASWFEEKEDWIPEFWIYRPEDPNFDRSAMFEEGFVFQLSHMSCFCHVARISEVAWKFRRKFWKRWLQLTFLGTPSLLFYGLNDGRSLRSGSVVYGFITCVLLLYYKTVNQKTHVISVTHDTLKNVAFSKSFENSQSVLNFHENVAELGWDAILFELIYFEKDLKLSVVFNSFEVIYTVWTATCVVVVALQSISITSSFYKCLITVGLISATSLCMKWFADRFIFQQS